MWDFTATTPAVHRAFATTLFALRAGYGTPIRTPKGPGQMNRSGE
jgi:hypothetical protein